MSTKPLKLKKICKEVIELTHEVGDFILKEKNKFNPSDIQKKGFNDLVSYVDKTSEKRLIKGLHKILPGSGILGEEGGGNFDNKYTWVIDPLDGTTNFIHSIPLYAISIALKQNDEIVVGVVYEINLKECFYAWIGGDAYLNESIIKVSETADINDSLIATGFPYYDYSRLNEYMNIFTYLLQNSRGLRRLGSAAVDLAYVACGRFEAFYEYGLRPWDVAAGAFIVQQAGGVNTDFSGGDNYIFGKEIISCTKNMNDAFTELIKSNFN